MNKIKRRFLQILIGLAVLYLLLLIPDANNATIIKASEKPFAWNKDDLWLQLENDFKNARQQPKAKIDSATQKLFETGESLYTKIQPGIVAVTDTNFAALSRSFFSLASLVAAQPSQRDSFINFYIKIRRDVKNRSRHWDMNDKTVRNLLYQQLYGMRAAVEEVLLQTDNIPFKCDMLVSNEPSATPYTSIFGIKVHSGDLLVSRGGAEVSALISRGNDYPGNFSHVALIYVDEKNKPFLIEAHIEKGVAIASVEEYIKDKKLRFMVLRPKADLPQLKADPLLPQKAAKLAYDDAKSRHIPYDFKMNFKDSAALFCSEVGSYAYRKNGVQLWQGVSTISSQGVVNWLHAFGVENFVTQMPSDLEYDPQLSIVAEWRNPETLNKDHIDNAVMDVLLEAADKGRPIHYSTMQLPFVRIVKGWCVIKNYFGKAAIIPEGMTATQALKSQYFVAMYNKLREETTILTVQFINASHYRPPYWQLVNIARRADNKINK
ncbi:MAG: YiiX/YebB-like N1pC/P60 family cysteine hydrolase [Ferruginibacter sp.]